MRRRKRGRGSGTAIFAGSWKRRYAGIIRFVRTLGKSANGSLAGLAMFVLGSRNGWQRLRQRRKQRSARRQRRQRERLAAVPFRQRKLGERRAEFRQGTRA